MKTIAINLSYLPIYGVSLVLLSALVFTPFYSYAQISITTGTNASGTVELNSSDNNGSTTESGLEVELNADSNVSASSTTGSTADTEVESDTTLRLNSEGVAVIMVEDIKNDSDLEVFAHNTAVKEERVSDVKIESKDNGAWQTTVSYLHEGKLLGLMLVNLKSTTWVEVDAEGKLDVESNLPWWHFLVTEKNHAEAELESRIRDNATIMAATEVEANAVVKAQVVEAIIAELNSHTYIHAAINAR